MRQEVLAEAAWHKHMAVPMGDDRRLTLSIPRTHLTALDKTTLICPLMLVLAPASAAASPSTLYTFVEFVGFDEENSSRARAAVVITQALATRDGLIELQVRRRALARNGGPNSAGRAFSLSFSLFLRKCTARSKRRKSALCASPSQSMSPSCHAGIFAHAANGAHRQ